MDAPIVNLEFLKNRPLSASSLKAFKRSPMHYIHYLTAPREAPKPPQVLGSLVDCMLLTEDDFNSKYIVEIQCDRRTKEGKAKWEEFIASLGNKLIVTQEQVDIARSMYEAVKNNAEAQEVLHQITQTQSCNKWTDEITQLPLLGLLDGEGDNMILELKSTKDASYNSFQKDCINYDYPLQLGMYYESLLAKGKKNIQAKYIAVENTAPFGVCVYTASKDYINYGRSMLEGLLHNFKICLNEGYFGGYKSQTLELPNWVKYKK